MDDGSAEVERTTITRGARWSLITLLAKQGSRIGFTLVLARLLGPENFGIIGQATIYLSFSLVFLDVGVAAVLIQRRTLDRTLIATATTLNLVVMAVLVGFTLATAGFWAGFFDTPELAGVLSVLSLTFVFSGLTVIPGALLTRQLEFKQLGVAEVVSTAVGGTAGVVAAVMGASYWALVVQTLVRDAVFMAMLLVLTGRPIVGWSSKAFAGMFSMSRNVFGGQLLRFLDQNSDNFIVAIRLGPTALGNYTLSYRVLMLPVQILGQTANRLLFPVFSRLQHDGKRLARYYVSTVGTLALTVSPVMVLLALTAPTVVPLAFGDEWEAAIAPMQVLSVASIVRVLVAPDSAVLLACNKAHWLFRYGLLNTAALVGSFLIGVRWGIVGVAWAYLLVGIPLAAVKINMSGRLIPVRARDYAGAVLPSVVGALAMTAGWFAVDASLGGALGVAGSLVVGSLAGLGAFLAVLVVGWRRFLIEQVALAGSLVGRGAGAPKVASGAGLDDDKADGPDDIDDDGPAGGGEVDGH